MDTAASSMHIRAHGTHTSLSIVVSRCVRFQVEGQRQLEFVLAQEGAGRIAEAAGKAYFALASTSLATLIAPLPRFENGFSITYRFLYSVPRFVRMLCCRVGSCLVCCSVYGTTARKCVQDQACMVSSLVEMQAATSSEQYCNTWGT